MNGHRARALRHEATAITEKSPRLWRVTYRALKREYIRARRAGR